MKIGDRVYYHPENSNIAIECYIEGIFDANPDLVWLDEVVGHTVDVDNLYESFDHARQHITSWSLSYKSLEDYRNRRAIGIMSTWPEENRTDTEEFLKMFEERKFIILET